MKPREPRSKCLVNARMRLDDAWSDVCIRDISSRGMLLEAVSAPRRGKYVELRKGRHVVVARVVWSTDCRFGIQSQDCLNVRGILGEPDFSGNRINQKTEAQLVFEQRTRELKKGEVRWKAEQSRTIARATEFAGVGVVIISFGYFLAITVYDALFVPIKAVSAALS